MADDPRDDTRQGIIGDWCPEYSEAGQRTLLAELDRLTNIANDLAAGSAVPVVTPPTEFERMLADPRSVAWHKRYSSPEVKQAICVLEENGVLAVPVATPTEPAQDYRLCSGGFRTADGQAIPCEHGEIGPHRPPAEQDGQR